MRGKRRPASAPGTVLAVVLAAALAGCVGRPAGEAPATKGPSGTSSAATTSSSDPVETSGPTATTSRPPAPMTASGKGSVAPPGPSRTQTAKLPTFPTSTAPVATRTFGADASWPQCPEGMGIPQKRTQGRPMPTAAAEFVVLGLTNGVSFVANPCLADQVAWVAQRHLLASAYSLVTYPDDATLSALHDRGPFPGGTRLGGLRNLGYQAALYNLDTMRRAGLETPVVWIDVEPVTGFDWSPDVVANAAVVQGVERGYRDAGLRIGYYSIGSLWTSVVGTLRTGAPEWRPAGERGVGEALHRCAADWSFGGGRGVLGQWIEDGRDRDVVCPGAMPDLRQWFHRY